MISNLPPEAINHIIEYLPTSDALVARRTSSAWNEHIRHCAGLWASAFQERYPISYRRCMEELSVLKARCDGFLTYREGVDYVGELSRLSREKYSSTTSHDRSSSVVVAPCKESKFFSFLRALTWKKKEFRMMILGLDGAGKSVMLYRWLKGEDAEIEVSKTVGFRLETLKRKHLNLVTWDLPGNVRFRPLYRHFYDGPQCVVFVFDAVNESRFRESMDLLETFVLPHEHLATLPLLIMANKQDCVGAISIEIIVTELRRILKVEDKRRWCVQGCSAVNSKGLDAGLDWLCGQLLNV